jgi:putative membrane protein
MINHEGWYFFGGGFMGLIWLLIIAGVILFVVFAVRGRNQGSVGQSGFNKDLEDPLAILKQRYARGEIDEEEYRRRKHELEQ